MAKLSSKGIDEAVSNRILHFLNHAESAKAISDFGGIKDDTSFGYGDQIQDYDIGEVVAQRILDKRDALGGFTDLSQLSDIKGFGIDKFNDLISSFSSSIYPHKGRKITTELFKFATVRNPKKVNTKGGTVKFIKFDPVSVGSEVLTGSNAESRKGKDFSHEQVADRAQAYQQGGKYLNSEEELDQIAPGMVDFGDWLLENKGNLTPQSAKLAAAKVQSPDAAVIAQVWDNLFVHLSLGDEDSFTSKLMAVIRGASFLSRLESEVGLESDEEARDAANATVVVPRVVFPQKKVEEVTVEDNPIYNTVEREQLKQKIASYEAAVAELQEELDFQMEALRLQSPRNGEQLSNTQKSESLLMDRLDGATLQSVSESTRNILREERVQEGARIVFGIEKLNRGIKRANQKLWDGLKPVRRVIKLGGGLWTETLPNEAAQRPTEDRPAPYAKIDSYDGFYYQNDRCRIKPLGVMDLRRVEQELCCYADGEVAHIENILQGEYKERSTRRLKRKEEFFSITNERESIEERDTMTTDRYEMHSETTKTIQKDMAFDLGVTASYFGPVNVTVNSNFATSSSTFQSDQQAVSYAKDVTERSLSRIVERVSEERTTKTLEEFEENNSHILDNRNGDGHVVGLYKWVDKIYKAQVVNYGKRLMFEFWIPEPGAFHLWAMSKPAAAAGLELELPIDPRSNDTYHAFGLSPIRSHTDITTGNYAVWAAAYGAPVDAPPPNYQRIGVAIEDSKDPIEHATKRLSTGLDKSAKVPEGYEATQASVTADFADDGEGSRDPSAIVYVANTGFWFSQSSGTRGATRTYGIYHTNEVIPITYRANWTDHFICNIEIDCYLLPWALEAWKIKTYEAILNAYNEKKAAYDNALVEAKVRRGVDIQGTNPALNRQIEQAELKKGCINWLFRGQTFSGSSVWNYDSADSCKPPVTGAGCSAIHEANRVRFVEHAFEWKLMTYLFYPYFWANKCRWQLLYRLNDVDPLFQTFLQAGMARVLVPVRPGYEEAAMHFLRSGRIWDGADLPGIDSSIYLSIVDEMKEPAGTVEGDPWEIRVPTSLTVLQCNSGCVDGNGLPCDCEDETALGTNAQHQLTGIEHDADEDHDLAD